MIDVKQTEDGKWGLFLDEVLLATSKQRFDADLGKQVILRWMRNTEIYELLESIENDTKTIPEGLWKRICAATGKVY